MVSTSADTIIFQQCSREWPCNHCQARKVPHLCQFATRKVITPERETPAGLAKYVKILSCPAHILLTLCSRRLPRKRKEDSLEADSPALADEPNHGLSDGLAKLGYMPSHGVFALAKSSADVSSKQARHGFFVLSLIISPAFRQPSRGFPWEPA